MKLQDLFERAKFTSSTIAYHATSLENLRSILKQGLVPNLKDDGYGSGEKSEAGYSLNPLKGIYLTLSYKDVIHIGKSISEEPLVIICSVQNRSASLDEDRLTSEIIDERGLAKTIKSSLRKFNDYDDEDLFNQFQDNLSDDLTDGIVSNNLSKYDRRLISNVIPYIKNYVRLLVDVYAQGSISFDHEDWNSQLKTAQEQLTLKLKNVLHHDEDKTQTTFKIDQTISFSGANKIVGLYNLNSDVGWGNLGEFERDAYHKVKTPIELVKQ